MDTVVRLSGGRLVATYCGACDTASGIAIWVGNRAVGALLGTAMRRLPWVAPAATGLGCTGLVARLRRAGRLAPRSVPVPA
ncbi:hypothetical protein ACFCW6_25700 [Streptomyces sp. NPDC056333]|uniref:hypothetical protein n=1 Tax=Streptomyces sp. NPDC056333 TaxID=3345786 RepID=UPI0035DE1763